MNKNEISFEDLQSRISNFIDKANLSSSNIQFNFKTNASDVEHFKLSSVQGMNVYRIIQEAINNAIKYADAQTILVDFNYTKNHLNVSVIDDGKGFDLETIQLGNGINNMKKRAHEIDGELHVMSNENEGTTIQLKLQNLKKYTTNDV